MVAAFVLSISFRRSRGVKKRFFFVGRSVYCVEIEGLHLLVDILDTLWNLGVAFFWSIRRLKGDGCVGQSFFPLVKRCRLRFLVDLSVGRKVRVLYFGLSFRR